jgi:hypothetical protein
MEKIIIFVVCLCLSGTALAKKTQTQINCPDIPEDNDAAIEMGADLFENGEKLATENKFIKALIEFLCAAKIKEHINITLNIAQTARYVKNKSRLIKILKEYISQNPNTETSRELKKIVSKIEE